MNAAPKGPFDLIVCSEVLYYIGGQVGDAARELTARLAPGGTLVLEHPYPESGSLHKAFLDHAGLEVQERTVAPHSIRPFEVLTLRRHA